MGKIICLMGKSSTGKDTIFKHLLADRKLGLEKIVPYTTRPIRDGERDGVEYFFRNEQDFQEMKGQGRIIEDREYHTMHGLWRYFVADDGQIKQSGNYIMIGTLEAYRHLQDYFGEDRVLPVMIELDDGARLQRALNRERKQENPKYGEMCRRFLADCEDFSEERIADAGISERFINNNLEQCLERIRRYIENGVKKP